MTRLSSQIISILILVVPMLSACSASGKKDIARQELPDEKFGFGRIATQTEIDSIDIDIMPDGSGLPPGEGNFIAGRLLFESKCISCHGANGPQARLIGAMGDTIKAKTIGNYWPYATTIFDYIRRSMPFNAPGSLNNDEVYHLTAFLLVSNKIVDSGFVVTDKNLAGITMPAKKFYVDDDRRGGAEIR